MRHYGDGGGGVEINAWTSLTSQWGIVPASDKGEIATDSNTNLQALKTISIRSRYNKLGSLT